MSHASTLRLAASVFAMTLLTSGILVPELLGAVTPEYSSLADYLSALGALGAPHRLVASYLGFLPVAVSVTAMVVLLWMRLPRTMLVRCGLLSVLGIAVGYLGAIAFPCDPGCPATGSLRQSIHNLSGLIEYLGGIAGLVLLHIGLRATASRAVRLATLGAIATVALGVVMMSSPELSHVRGAS